MTATENSYPTEAEKNRVNIEASKTTESSQSIIEKFNTNVVDFESADDPTNPLNWSTSYKWVIVVLLTLMNVMVNLGTVVCAPAAPQILTTFHSDNPLDATLIVSMWEMGEIVGPLIVAPLAELYGKMLVYNAANALFIIFSVASATSSNLNMLIAFRCLNGLAVASPILNSAVVGDMFKPEQRGSAISLAGVSALIGVIIGPIAGGYLTDLKGWRWTFWLVVIVAGVIGSIFFLCFRESYKITILQKKTNRLRKETGNHSLRSKYDTGLSKSDLFKRSIIRPLKLLILSPIVLLLSIYVSVVYGILYLVITTLTEVFEGSYGFAQGPVGLSFIGIGVGMMIGILLCRFVLDRLIKTKTGSGTKQPEYRLLPMVVGGIIVPSGLILYGWSAEYHVHWIVPIVGTATLGFGLVVTSISSLTYLVDTYTIHAASATAGCIVLRNLSGAVFPLAGPPLYGKLGLGRGNTVIASIALATLPIPVILMRYGKRMRTSSRLGISF